MDQILHVLQPDLHIIHHRMLPRGQIHHLRHKQQQQQRQQQCLPIRSVRRAQHGNGQQHHEQLSTGDSDRSALIRGFYNSRSRRGRGWRRCRRPSAVHHRGVHVEDRGEAGGGIYRPRVQESYRVRYTVHQERNINKGKGTSLLMLSFKQASFLSPWLIIKARPSPATQREETLRE